jgi:hypothetical protein
MIKALDSKLMLAACFNQNYDKKLNLLEKSAIRLSKNFSKTMKKSNKEF